MDKKEKRKNKLSLYERWKIDDAQYQQMSHKGFQCNTCKYYMGYPKCNKYGIIPNWVMEKDCGKYEEA